MTHAIISALFEMLPGFVAVAFMFAGVRSDAR